MTIGFAMTRTLMLRHRVGIAIVLCYALLTSAVVLTIGQENLNPSWAMVMFSGLVVGCFYLLTVFMHSDSDLATPGSTYPNYYFTLPVKTLDLVLWPVGSGIVFMGGLTFVLSFIIHRAGYDIDPVGAALVAVSTLTVLQAVFWYPLGIPYSKLVLAILATLTIILIGLSKLAFGASDSQRLMLFGGLILLSMIATWRGVAKARAGDVLAPSLGRTRTGRKRMAKVREFRSAAQAQFWYEWRQQGKTLPALSLILFLIVLSPLYTNDTLSSFISLRNREGLLAYFPTYLTAYYPAMAILMAAYGWAIGCGAKRTDLKRSDRTFHLFFGTRPMRDEDMVWTKMKVAAASTLYAWGLFFLASLPLLLMKGGFAPRGQSVETEIPLYSVVAQLVNGQNLLYVFFAVSGLMLLTWRNYVIGFWAELSGSLALRYIQPVAAIAVGILAAPFAMNGSTWFTILLAAGVLVKWGVAVWLSVRQVRSGVLLKRSLWRLLAGYVAAVVVFEVITGLVVAPMWESMDSVEARASLIQAAAAWALLIVWLVPLNRILGAVGALAWNRHR